MHAIPLLPRNLSRTLAAGALVALAAPALPAAAGPPTTGKAGKVAWEYVEPKDAALRPAYDAVRKAQVLETITGVLGTVKLPHPMKLVFRGCDGESNAWYDNEDHQVTYCYEFVRDIDKAAEGAGEYGIARQAAAMGPVFYFFLHECAHALFDVLQVPLFGREEDGADQLAAFILLETGNQNAGPALAGTAYAFKHDALKRTLDESDYADVHGLDVQRLYNVMCMAYGYDSVEYARAVEKGYLPKERAEECPGEYAQVTRAVRRLISPNLDPKAVERLKAAHRKKARITAPTPAASEGGAGAKPAGN